MWEFLENVFIHTPFMMVLHIARVFLSCTCSSSLGTCDDSARRHDEWVNDLDPHFWLGSFPINTICKEEVLGYVCGHLNNFGLPRSSRRRNYTRWKRGKCLQICKQNWPMRYWKSSQGRKMSVACLWVQHRLESCCNQWIKVFLGDMFMEYKLLNKFYKRSV